MSLPKKLVKLCKYCNNEFEKPYAESLTAWNFRHKYCSKDCYNKSKIGQPTWNKGKQGLQVAWNKGLKGYMAGEKNPNWRGGLAERLKYRKIRRSIESDMWRCSVLVRDNFTCKICNKYPVNIADHIKSFANFPELRFNIKNGRAVCKPCHRKLPTSNGSRILRDKTL